MTDTFLQDRYAISCTNGKESGSDDKYRKGTTCNFECKRGFYQSSGSKKVNCLDTAQWDMERAKCEGICICC